MRIPSGVTDQVIYFVAVDVTDLKTRETGLSSFTVYRSRNAATTAPEAGVMSSPTVTQVDSTNAPGLYSLLLDEDMTIGTGNDSEEMAFHITQADMAPVTRTIELYRPKVTAGETITASGGAVSSVAAVSGAVGSVTGSVGSVTGSVGSVGSGGITAASLASDAGNEIATALLDLANGVESGVTLRQALRAMAAVLAGKASGGPGSSVFKGVSTSTTRVTSVSDTNGDRSSVTLNL